MRIPTRTGLITIGLVAFTALAVDQNNNGVSDMYERLYSIDPSMLDLDLDGDGLTCRQEAEFGTDPRNAASLPCAVVASATGGLELHWDSVVGIRYQIQSSVDLTGWVAVGDVLTGAGTEMAVPCPIAEARRFFRIAAQPSPDSDGDGLTAFEEGLYRSSDNAADSDGDGLTDSGEFDLGTNPTSGDSDGDGIGDGDEASQGGDPTDPADGLPPNPEKRPFVVRMTYYAGWPNYPISVPPIPALDFTIRDVVLDSIVGHVTQAAAFTGDARPLGFFSGYTPSGGPPDPTITRGREYELKMNYARGNGLWKSGANGRIFSPASLNPTGETINLLVYSARFNGGSYYISNATGGVWLESNWQATGAPTNSVANSQQFYVHDTLCPTARMWAVDFDLDLDSDNDNLSALPDQSQAEDDIETTQPKFVAQNSNDDDADGVIDSADLDNKKEQDFVPLILDVAPASLPYEKISIKLRYAGAANYAANQTGDLRLWRVNSPKVLRTTAEYIQPDYAYAAADLGVDAHNPHVKLLIEALTEVPEPSDIEAVFLFNGVEYFTDKVRVWGGASVGLAVDADRDGQIKTPAEDASDATSADKPFRFWLNDDNDESALYTWTNGSTFTERELDDAAVGGDSDKNCNNLVIDTERDLEDLARLWIYTKGLNASFKSGDLQLGLKWTDVSAGDPAIRLFHAVDADGGDGYLFNSSMASLQVDQAAASGAHGMAVGNVIGGTDPVILPQTLFADLTEDKPKTCLLFEGIRAGKGQLKLLILDKSGTVIGEGPGVWMELKELGDLVERYTCGDGSMGTVGALTQYPQTATFAAPATEDENDYVLYVHGYNMEDPLKQRWIETAYKRLYWLGYSGRVGGFSWPCAFGLVDQVYFDDSENRAWQAGERLKEHLVNLKNRGYRVHVIGHSQGNIVVGEALRLWKASGQSTPLVSTYIASQAAIAAHCYNAAAPLMPDHQEDTPNVYACYWRSGDSARFPQTWPTTNPPYLAAATMQSTAGRWVNFYNPQDYALTAANGGIGSWENDQRLKPDNFYNWSVANGFFKGWVPFETAYSFPGDRYAIFSYCAEARSVAVGTIPTGGVFSGDTVDLESQCGFSRAHLWHSGQFRSFSAARYGYWSETLRRIGIQPYTP